MFASSAPIRRSGGIERTLATFKHEVFDHKEPVMLSDNQVVATIPVSDAKRAKTFYHDMLGLTAMDERPGVTSYRSGGFSLFVYESDKAGTNKATAATWITSDVDGVVKDLKDRGVAFERYDDVPGLVTKGDIHVGGDGAFKVAWFKDPDGNILSIMNG
jgi:catechol 2,3-dioxygenase-like lactoylglutathione lyase family enzyme